MNKITVRMTIVEAIRELKEQWEKREEKAGPVIFMWARPVSWRGFNEAVCLDSDGKYLQIVPRAHGGRSWNPSADDIIDDWEIVDPAVVCEERSTR